MLTGKRYSPLVAMGLCLTLLTGCAGALLVGGAAVGAGTVAYVTGELKAVEEAPLDQVWNATRKAVDDLEFVTTRANKDALTGKLTALGADKKKIHINLKKKTRNLTEIRIRVGTFGDEMVSRTILDKIKARL